MKLSGRMRTVPFRPPGSEEDMPLEEPPEEGRLGRRDIEALKNVFLLMLAQMVSPMDAAIATKLIAGQTPEPGELQHIFDEVGRAQIPDDLKPVLRKAFDILQKMG